MISSSGELKSRAHTGTEVSGALHVLLRSVIYTQTTGFGNGEPWAHQTTHMAENNQDQEKKLTLLMSATTHIPCLSTCYNQEMKSR